MPIKYIKPILAGLIGMFALGTIYWLILYVASGDLTHPFDQFLIYKYWISALIIGFGIQMGLFWYIRSGLHLPDGHATTAAATGAGTSAVAMVACCAHHLTDFLPILGLSAAALFLTEYQVYLFGLGVVSNLFGINLMGYIIKTKTCPDFFQPFRNIISNQNQIMEKILLISGLIVAVIIGGFILVGRLGSDQSTPTTIASTNATKIYSTQINSQAAVDVEVTPVAISQSGEETILEVSLNTHTVELDYDFAAISTIQDDLGSVYFAREWTGRRGGHHLSGNLIFPTIDDLATSVTLKINGIGDADRSFEWQI
ncbi:MAG: hypothetical protein ABIG32_02555 [Candidatus Uhrbacteria bacterium]|nr:hypothetical protein [Patescibacteria group bacterium]MBU1907015.1 hypothetical protein [Patescibacteria group bacterium]